MEARGNCRGGKKSDASQLLVIVRVAPGGREITQDKLRKGRPTSLPALKGVCNHNDGGL